MLRDWTEGPVQVAAWLAFRGLKQSHDTDYDRLSRPLTLRLKLYLLRPFIVSFLIKGGSVIVLTCIAIPFRPESPSSLGQLIFATP